MNEFKSIVLPAYFSLVAKWLKWPIIVIIVGTLVWLASIGLKGLIIDSSIENPDTYRIQYEKEAELAYWDARYLLNCEVQNYIDSVAKTSNLRAYDLIELVDKYDVDIKFVLAQGEIESHFGTKGIAARTNSVWNVGAYDGASVDEIHGKHKFHHPNESIEPYLQLLTTKYLIDGRLEVDLMKSYTTKSGARYATAKDYETRLKAKYDWITDHTRIDALYEQLRYYAIKCGRS
jgi:hypothetical protein